MLLLAKIVVTAILAGVSLPLVTGPADNATGTYQGNDLQNLNVSGTELQTTMTSMELHPAANGQTFQSVAGASAIQPVGSADQLPVGAQLR